MRDSPVERLRANIQSVFLGHARAVDLVLIGLVARGHILIEDVPGVGKTVLARALARSIDCKFSRIQLTPDLLPGDVLGVSVYNTLTQAFDFRPGPVFANIVLADEINRTTPRTQSALLEAMSEEQVSVENQTIPLQRPFMLVATQNPVEFEGTYHLPENQLDRFLLRIAVGYPERRSEHQILTTQPGRNALEKLRPVMDAAEVVELQDRLQRHQAGPGDRGLHPGPGARHAPERGPAPGRLAARRLGADAGGPGGGPGGGAGLRHAGRREVAVPAGLCAPRGQQDVPAQRRRRRDPGRSCRRSSTGCRRRDESALARAYAGGIPNAEPRT